MLFGMMNSDRHHPVSKVSRLYSPRDSSKMDYKFYIHSHHFDEEFQAIKQIEEENVRTKLIFSRSRKLQLFNIVKLIVFIIFIELFINNNHKVANCQVTNPSNTENNATREEELKFKFAYNHQPKATTHNGIDQRLKGTPIHEHDSDKLAYKLLLEYPSKRNADLLESLRKRRLNFRVFYPRRQVDFSGGREVRASGEYLDSDDLDLSDDEVYITSTRIQPQDLGHEQSKSQQVASGDQPKVRFTRTTSSRSNQVSGHYNRTNVIIKAFNYKFRLDLELNSNLFGPNLIQKNFLPKGGQQISSQKLEHCYYHARTQADARPQAIGAFRTCNGLSGIIHVNKESFVIHPFYDAEIRKKHPHIIYRYQTSTVQTKYRDNQNKEQSIGNQELGQEQLLRRECGNTRLHQWALRQYNKLATLSSRSQRHLGKRLAKGDQVNSRLNDSGGNSCDSDDMSGSRVETNVTSKGNGSLATQKNHLLAAESDAGDSKSPLRFSKRDVSLTEKYIEIALVLSKDMFEKRNSSSRIEVLHDSIQIVNCLDLYFRSANTRVALIYVETWPHGDQIELTNDVKQTLYNFLEYSSRKLYKVSMDAAHLLAGGHQRQFEANEVGMAIPDSICSSRAVSVSQDSSVFEPFVTASTMAHMLGHNLGMEHDDSSPPTSTDFKAKVDTPRGLWSDTKATLAETGSRQPVSSGRQATKQVHSKHSESDAEDHEDELGRRSLISMEQSMARLSARQLMVTNEQLEESQCKSNCLMSESFFYLQPPVSFGNMIQLAGNGNGTLHGLGEASGASVSSFQTIADPQEEQLNGSTMDQIDIQLEREHSMAASLPFRFSRKSLETYHKLLSLGQGICLFNKPNQLEDFKTCGNGIVDKGEDCDCGSFQECLESDSCCDPITCRFKADAECINGACCDRCRLRARGFVCRKARGECDLAEACDGKSAQCAPDVHKQNGYPCNSGSGYCFLGLCPNHDAQCAELWGSDARNSDKICYSNFNSNGTIRGNCGLENTLRKYKRCELEHMMCGTLQCQLGDMKPATAPIDSQTTTRHGDSNTLNGDSSLVSQQQHQIGAQTTHEFSKKLLHSIDGSQHECKVITRAGGLANSNQLHQPVSSSISYVRDGTKCAAGRVCFNQTCQPLESVYKDAYELCPKDERGRQCSGNGICSTANRCLCESQWTGHDCSQRWPDDISLQVSGTANISNKLEDQRASNMSRVEVRLTMPTFNSNPINGPSIKPEASSTLIQGPTSTSSSPQASTTTFAPASTNSSTTSYSGLDRKKHDALGAPTLVFILVSIVAAVYVGFALMANCYRRKGFYKPDKVLRHHQMNCKLDALRSSFIAKRLADAEAVASSLENGSNPSACGPVITGAPTNGVDLLSPFVTPLLGQSNCQHGSSPVYNPANQTSASKITEVLIPSDEQMLSNPSYSSVIQPSSHHHHHHRPQHPSMNRSSAGNKHQMNQQMASVHYFGNPNDFVHQRAIESNLDPNLPIHPNGHIGAGSRNQRTTNQQSMRTFHARRPPPIETRTQPNLSDLQWDHRLSERQIDIDSSRVQSRRSKAEGQAMNRTTSLGNVNGRHICGQGDDRFKEDDEESRRAMSAHRALATPVRSNNIIHTSMGVYRNYKRAHLEDSCSAPSSPEPRDVCWSGCQGRNTGQLDGHKGLTRSTLSKQQSKQLSYHEDIIFNAVNSDRTQHYKVQARRSREEDDDDMPPLPPPPLSGGPLDTEEINTDDDNSGCETISDRHTTRLSGNPRLGETSVTCKSQVSSTRTIKRVPLSGEQLEPKQVHYAGFEQLSLIAQLQQLEEVQSLHQKQVAADKSKSGSGTGESLHEFFSLPLSVQLSALLARSLNESREFSLSSIDDLLNNLNNSSVANLSRRSFKGINHQQQQSQFSSSSRGGTLKRQQTKLQNLQGLINRLQKLHNQTVLQQQLEELNGDYDDDLMLNDRSSRHSTLGRSSRAQSVTRFGEEETDSRPISAQRGLRSRTRTTFRTSKDNLASKNESIHSMSDSEDGLFVGRILKSGKQRENSAQLGNPTSTRVGDGNKASNNLATTFKAQGGENDKEADESTDQVPAESSVSPSPAEHLSADSSGNKH